MVGYSGKPLAKKLGITEHTRIFVCDAPLDYAHLLGPLARGPLIVKSIDERTDLVHVFAKEKKRLADRLSEVLPKLRPNAAIWVSWPKKASKVATDITEDVIREIALPMGLVDIKVCAVDETWSGLKLVIRKENR